MERNKNEFLTPQIFKTIDDPAFFQIFIEKRHADHLSKKDIDEESRLEVIQSSQEPTSQSQERPLDPQEGERGGAQKSVGAQEKNLVGSAEGVQGKHR